MVTFWFETLKDDPAKWLGLNRIWCPEARGVSGSQETTRCWTNFNRSKSWPQTGGHDPKLVQHLVVSGEGDVGAYLADREELGEMNLLHQRTGGVRP